MFNETFQNGSFCVGIEVKNDPLNLPRVGSKTVFHAPRSFQELIFVILILQVSWFRKEAGILTVLTIGQSAFIADDRFSSAYNSLNDWRLRIKPTNPRDNGTYLCQISTHPPTLLVTHLQVIGKWTISHAYFQNKRRSLKI